MIYKFILILIPFLIVGCASDPSDQKIYKHKDLGIQIIAPENWRAISSSEAGQDDTDVSPNDIYLGYFDPDTGEKKGIFVFSIWGKIETKQDMNDFDEAMNNLNKVTWNNRSCFFTQDDSENSAGINYTMIEDDTVIAFFVGYSKSHTESVTNIMNNIIF